MSAQTPGEQAWDAAAAVVPCALVAVVVVADWPWWVAVLVVAAALAGYARFAGLTRAAISAMFATPAVALVVERDGSGPVPVRVAELGALGLFLSIAALVGRAVPHKPSEK